MVNSSGEVKRIDPLCIEVIEHIRKRMSDEWRKKYGYDREFSFKDASKLMAFKVRHPTVFDMIFGKVPVEKFKKVLEMR